MNKTCSLIFISALCAANALAAENPWADYRQAPDALREIDLASDTEWTLSIDGATPRPIKVTAGGWNSDQQEPQIPSADVKDYATYERQITIPAEAKDQVVKILFGGCNYGAEVFLDERKVTEHNAPMTPFAVDLTGLVTPGKTCRLQVKAYTRYHFGRPPTVPAGFDFNKGMGMDKDKVFDGHTKFAYGLTGYVRLAIYPPVYISDVFAQPSVAGKMLTYDVWVTNASKTAKSVILKSSLTPWNKREWNYPSLPDREIQIPAGETVKATIKAPWNLGSESYWWPNIPYRTDYQAVLHHLSLALVEGSRTISQRTQRFGFVEYKEGPVYYTVNGVRFTSFGDSNSYGQVGEYDCWTETPCFQPPAENAAGGQAGRKGCPETWRRYQQIGFNSMRLSTSVPTRYMLETADEAGYMLVPEGGSWGNLTSLFQKENFSFQLQETIRACRNHPCVARYSLANESLPADFASEKNPWRWLIDAALEVDPTRPYVFEVNTKQTGAVPGMKGGHAHQMEHYQPIVPSIDHIRGMGECAWATDGMAGFTRQALAMRLNDWAHFAPWSWVNYWPNFLEGMNSQRHPWKTNNYGDRKDGVDGWGSPIVRFTQRSLHPYLVQDHGVLKENPGSPLHLGEGKIQWPCQGACIAGKPTERAIEVFNGGLSGNALTLVWSLHWNTPDGPVAAPGGELPCTIEPGFHATQKITFTVPALENGKDKRDVCLVLESRKDGKTVFRDDTLSLTVYAKDIATSAQHLGMDEKTQGNWRGKYGAEGHVLVGREKEMPGFTQFAWLRGASYIYEKQTEDIRALEFFQSDTPTTPHDRIAAVEHGSDIAFEIHVGTQPHRLAIYSLDWDRKGREQEVEIQDAVNAQTLDKQTVKDFADGRYLTWKVQGRLRIVVRKINGINATVSGIFLDPIAP